jgi:signal transduction histidine kinase
MIYFLAMLILARLRFVRIGGLIWGLFIIESGFVGYISYHYEGMMFLALLSTLISLFDTSAPQPLLKQQIAGIALLMIVYNISIMHQPATTQLTGNIMFVLTGLLLICLRIASTQKYQAETLYDQLSLSHLELEDARRRLVQYAQQVEQFAQLEERNRISKDIHDDLGHRLIRQKMMTEAALQIFPSQPEQALSLLEQVRDQMSDSMETLRRTVRKIAPAAKEVQQYSLEQLMHTTSETLGIQVTYQVEGLPYALYPSIEYVLYRNAQEAITNAIRHGQATKVTITLQYEPEQVSMRICNNGSQPSGSIRQGLGMRGMEERVHIIGGSIDWSNTEQFCMITRLPHYPTQRVYS